METPQWAAYFQDRPLSTPLYFSQDFIFFYHTTAVQIVGKAYSGRPCFLERNEGALHVCLTLAQKSRRTQSLILYCFICCHFFKLPGKTILRQKHLSFDSGRRIRVETGTGHVTIISTIGVVDFDRLHLIPSLQRKFTLFRVYKEWKNISQLRSGMFQSCGAGFMLFTGWFI